jgi:hypothetical protein
MAAQLAAGVAVLVLAGAALADDFPNEDPTAPWNDYLRKDDPTAPWNDYLRKDDPTAPWNRWVTPAEIEEEDLDDDSHERRK